MVGIFILIPDCDTPVIASGGVETTLKVAKDVPFIVRLDLAGTPDRLSIRCLGLRQYNPVVGLTATWIVACKCPVEV